MILDGKALSAQIKDDLTKKVKNYLIKPCLAVIQIGNDEASNVYIKAKEKACNTVGINFIHVKFEEDTTEQEVINKIVELNNDTYVNGILLQLPLPSQFNQDKLLNLINKNKHVDGLTDINAGLLFKGNNNLVPCTPLGIVTLLKEYKIDLIGKHVVIIGKSNLVGKPLAILLLQEGATVTICHSKTNNLKQFTKQADILVSAVGKKDLVTKDMVKENSVIIDVGINRVAGKLYGDVDFENVKDIVSFITPVPGGVGPMTVAMLLSNVVKNYEKNL
mgnify:CR=1 FL=1